MTPDDIRFVLAAYRPGTDDENDPQFRDALARMKSDSELKVWFDEQMALSRSLSEKLRDIPVPPQLRADILAGAKVSAPPASKRRRRWPQVLAVAACILLTGASVFLWLNRFVPSGPETWAAYQNDMGSYLSGFFLLDYESEDLEDVKQWLSKNHGVTNYTVPASLKQYPSLGCEVIEWHDREAYLICFNVDGELVHLFALPNDEGLPGAPTITAPGFIAQSGEWTMTGWREDGQLYLVSTLGNSEFLKRSLGVQG